MRTKQVARRQTGGKKLKERDYFTGTPNLPFWWTVYSGYLKDMKPGQNLTSPIFERLDQKFRMILDPSNELIKKAQLSLLLLSKPASSFSIRIKFSFTNCEQIHTPEPVSFEHLLGNDYSEQSTTCAVYSLEGRFDSICCQIEKIDTFTANSAFTISDAPPSKKPLLILDNEELGPTFDSPSKESFKPVEETTVSSSSISPIDNNIPLMNGSPTVHAEKSELKQIRRSTRKLKSLTKFSSKTSSRASFGKSSASLSVPSPCVSTASTGSSNLYLKACNDIGTLLFNAKYSDVVLVVKNDNSFRRQAHKAIISSRSSVFSELCEKNDKEIILDDISFEILEKLLIFMYSGDVCDLHSCAMDVFHAAEKYALPDLMEVCVESMKNNLSCETAADTLIIAHENNLEDLKARTMEFINRNAAQVIKTHGYRKILESYMDLVADLYHCLISTSKFLTIITLILSS
ncbi:hypothetical protein QAD02_022263 [Eretmocerus hayati]|uniref:Uncharacterized protein n=1 Tax=Eretmocerus hayati TaxID=131215 RepID=A0ACC2PSA2_9HYME|nr:hypothetical protein QAD02_022263 [Eretmocerus hayati]